MTSAAMQDPGTLSVDEALRLEASLRAYFDGHPAAVAASISEIRLAAETPGYAEAVLRLFDPPLSAAQATLLFAVRRGELWRAPPRREAVA